MDFIVGLPKDGKNYVIMVEVDRLSKHAHFCALPHPFTPTLVAQVFLDHIFMLHGMPTLLYLIVTPLSQAHLEIVV
jgi:hypothetical protein